MLDRTKREAAASRKGSLNNEHQAVDDDTAAAAAMQTTIGPIGKQSGGKRRRSSDVRVEAQIQMNMEETMSVQDAGHVSDETSSEAAATAQHGEERLGGAGRKKRRSEADASATKTSSSVEPSSIRRGKRAHVSKGDTGVVSSVAAGNKSAPSDSMHLRPRKQSPYANAPPTKKPARPRTSMKLRKRPVPVKEIAGFGATRCLPVLDEHVSDVYRKHRRSIDTGECEVCLHPYALSYLSKHRNKVHGLSQHTLGCPYCSGVFSSPSERGKHIKDRHPGKPSAWSIDGCNDLSKVKAHVYACPLCPAHFTHSGLACHLGSAHDTSIDAFQGQVFPKCPFCMASPANGKQLGHFESEEKLREHISSKHKGCFLLDDIQPPSRRTFERPNRTQAADKRKAPPSLQVASDEEQDWNEAEDGSLPEEQEEDHWKRLNYSHLVADYVYGGYMSIDFGMNLQSAINAVDDELQTLLSNKNTNDEDYIAEMKLYNKGVKDRQQKADAERIEKERHKEEVERKLLRLDYENRNKKKRSLEDIEHDAFLERPILFASSSRKSSCPYGEHCDLCVSRNREPDTDESGQLIDAPSYHVNIVDDSLNNAASPSGKTASVGGAGKRASRRERRADPTTRSLLMLQELNHSLRFVAEYNEGYFRR